MRLSLIAMRPDWMSRSVGNKPKVPSRSMLRMCLGDPGMAARQLLHVATTRVPKTGSSPLEAPRQACVCADRPKVGFGGW